MFKDSVFHGLSCLPLISGQFRRKNLRNPRDVAPFTRESRKNTHERTFSFLRILCNKYDNSWERSQDRISIFIVTAASFQLPTCRKTK